MEKQRIRPSGATIIFYNSFCSALDKKAHGMPGDVVVCVDNNFRGRLARPTHVYFQRVASCQARPACGAKKERRRGARSSRFIGSPLHCRLISVMRCKQRYLLRAKRSARARAREATRLSQLSFHNNMLHNGALVIIVRPTDVNSIVGSNEELEYRDGAVEKNAR